MTHLAPPLAADQVASRSRGIASAATITALELPSLLAVVAELAATDLGRARALALVPQQDLEALQLRRRQYEEARLLLAERRLVGSFDFSLEQLIEEIASGRPTNLGLALVRLADVLRGTQELAGRIREATPPAPALAELTADLPDFSALLQGIGRKLDRRGEVREDASPKLAGLRNRIRGLRDSLYGQMRRHLEAEPEVYSEETVPMRGGRLVLVLAAGSKGRVPGLVHGRSATGKSFYFEPLEAVETNNDLQGATEEEEAERQRILLELLASARSDLPGLEAHAAFLAEVDLLQSMGRFAELADAHQAEIAEGGRLILRAARHPLLDPALAQLRQQALEASGLEKPVVPLDLELRPDARTLVVTGPNAGGKTVVLKTVGLLALAHQCGLPLPAAPGSRLPVLSAVVAAVGDEQDLLADRSTFSGRLLRLKEAWEAAGPDSLVLVDELGSGTDPEEGAALAVTLLEGLLEKGGLGVITTHLTPLAAAALDLPGAACAAMELDPATSAPTYHLLPGPPGGSEAIALARRLGLPREWLDRAEARLGQEHRDLRRLLGELERVRSEVSAERARLAAEASTQELASARLERERTALEAERKAVARQTKAELEAFRLETRRKLRDEMARLKAEMKAGRRRGLEAEAEQRLFEAAPVIIEPAPTAVLPALVGESVRHRGLGWTGILEKVNGARAEVLVKGKRVRCDVADLDGLPGERARAPRPEVHTEDREPASELHLLGRGIDDALLELDGYLDQALLSTANEVRVVHGHGSGRLRDAVREFLRRHPAVAASRPGAPSEGGNGATVVTLRTDR